MVKGKTVPYGAFGLGEEDDHGHITPAVPMVHVFVRVFTLALQFRDQISPCWGRFEYLRHECNYIIHHHTTSTGQATFHPASPEFSIVFMGVHQVFHLFHRASTEVPQPLLFSPQSPRRGENHADPIRSEPLPVVGGPMTPQQPLEVTPSRPSRSTESRRRERRERASRRCRKIRLLPYRDPVVPFQEVIGVIERSACFETGGKGRDECSVPTSSAIRETG